MTDTEFMHKASNSSTLFPSSYDDKRLLINKTSDFETVVEEDEKEENHALDVESSFYDFTEDNELAESARKKKSQSVIGLFD